MPPGSRPAGVARGGGGGAAGLAAAARELAIGPRTRTVVLVEGLSDRVALEVLADRRGRDLGAEGVVIVPMGGATPVARFLEGFAGTGRRLVVLCDAREEPLLQRALTRSGLTGVGVAVCHADLEDELIRALGTDAVEAVIERQGDAAGFARFVRQPAQRGRPPAAQLHRFLGTRSGRKWQYAALLVDALDLDHVPGPLDAVLAAV